MSHEAAEWALTYGQFHWGVTPWAFYCLPSIPIAYPMFVRRNPGVRLSVAAGGVLGRHVDSRAGVTIGPPGSGVVRGGRMTGK